VRDGIGNKLLHTVTLKGNGNIKTNNGGIVKVKKDRILAARRRQENGTQENRCSGEEEKSLYYSFKSGSDT
jgi:hypothetical protein